jgi:hypothetical protein
MLAPYIVVKFDASKVKTHPVNVRAKSIIKNDGSTVPKIVVKA